MMQTTVEIVGPTEEVNNAIALAIREFLLEKGWSYNVKVTGGRFARPVEGQPHVVVVAHPVDGGSGVALVPQPLNR